MFLWKARRYRLFFIIGRESSQDIQKECIEIHGFTKNAQALE